MAGKVSIRVNTSHAERVIAEYSVKAGAKVKKAVAGSALNVQRYSKRACPFRTGALSNSIAWDPLGDYSAEVVAKMPYAGHVEYGTYKQRAKPYMGPSAEREKPNFQKAIEGAVKG